MSVMTFKDLAEAEELERRLLDPKIRSSTEKMDQIIADDFVEFGRSGREWNKTGILDFLSKDPVVEIEIDSVRSRHISEDVILITYRSWRDGEAPVSYTLRSSTWQRRRDGWKLIFHQGTPIQPSD